MDQEGTILAPEGFYASSFSNSPEFSRVWSGRPNSGLQPIEGVSFFGGNYGIYPDDGVWKACVEL